MFTDINSEDRLVQKTFADYLHDTLGWDSVYAWNDETFGLAGNLGRDSERDGVLNRDLRDALARLNPNLPESARAEAFQKLTQVDYARSMLQHNQQFYKYIQDGVPVSWRDASGDVRHDHARVIDFRTVANNRFVAVREMKFTGLVLPHYNRRADIVCFVNGLALVFIDLKAVYRNIRRGFDDNLTDYMTQSIPHVFHHNAFLVVSNLDTQIFRTFVGCGIAADQTPRAASGKMLKALLQENHRFVFSLVHKFNQPVRRATVEQTFTALLALAQGLDQEQRRAAEEGLTEKELALFDLLYRENLSQGDRERLKQASKSLLARLQQLLAPMGHWTRNAQTQAEVQACILDWLFEALPRPPFTDSETEGLANRVYEYVWQQSEAGSVS